jgi:glyoxylase-like metal-dependent hydrolase (beta-lactamase superfamily II)
VNKIIKPLLVVICCFAFFAGCNVREMIMKKAVSDMENYFQAQGDEFVKLTERVYTYRWTWYRNIVIVTDQGLVVVDPFNHVAAKRLYEILKEKFPGKPVHTLIYSHYHLDHVTGGEMLHAQNIIAHEKCPQYWQDTKAKGVTQPTMFISGDRKLMIGNVQIDLLYMGKSHTDTLYAVYLPDEDLLFSTDFGIIKTIPPLGWPDCYIPGALKEAERIAELKFSIFVPSHFGYGTKSDFLETVEFMKYFRKLCREAIDKYGIDGAAFPLEGKKLQEMFEYVYYPLKERYGNWHGFNEMALIAGIRHLTGEMLGY